MARGAGRAAWPASGTATAARADRDRAGQVAPRRRSAGRRSGRRRRTRERPAHSAALGRLPALRVERHHLPRARLRAEAAAGAARDVHHPRLRPRLEHDGAARAGGLARDRVRALQAGVGDDRGGCRTRRGRGRRPPAGRAGRSCSCAPTLTRASDGCARPSLNSVQASSHRPQPVQRVASTTSMPSAVSRITQRRAAERAGPAARAPRHEIVAADAGLEEGAAIGHRGRG